MEPQQSKQPNQVLPKEYDKVIRTLVKSIAEANCWMDVVLATDALINAKSHAHFVRDEVNRFEREHGR